MNSSSFAILIVFYLLLIFFNIVFNTGCVPHEWCLGTIRPLYKNKGSVNDPDNNRGITLLSCTSKLFTSCLNNRLSKYKRIYCAFIDYRKAFDTIHRSLLWQKLQMYNVDGKFFDVITSMYNQAKSCIRKGEMMSEYFNCNIGVRQGDNISPLLFSLFINDFTSYIGARYQGLDISESCCPSIRNDDCIIYLKQFALLYVDDTIVLAENECELQLALDNIDTV